MRHPQNVACEDEEYFADSIDFVQMNNNKSLLNAYRVVSRSVYSRHARQKVARLLDRVRPDVVHLQNIHGHLTPSIVYEFEERAIPVVWTLHDYRLICPNTHLLSHGTVCEACKGGKFFSCTFKKCKKNSYAASFLASIEAYTHELQNITNKIQRFVAPSKFLQDKFIEFGWDEHKLAHVRNFLPTDKFVEKHNEGQGYGIYLGQLMPWKGIMTLLVAAKMTPHVRIVIVGDGTQRSELEDFARQNGIDNVEFLGYLTGKDLYNAMQSCSFLVAPSECYENCPYAVMEAMAFAKPVIASRIGGLPELVDDGLTGLLFESRNPIELAEKIRILASDSDLRYTMGRNAHEKARAEFGPELHFERLLTLYESVLGGSQTQRTAQVAGLG